MIQTQMAKKTGHRKELPQTENDTNYLKMNNTQPDKIRTSYVITWDKVAKFHWK